MTLITNPTRVHFADDVLEEALQSELERTNCARPLLIAERQMIDGELSDRVYAGLPRMSQPTPLAFRHDEDLRPLAATLDQRNILPDVIIAFGSSRAIELGRKCRYAVAQKNRARPSLYVIPGIDGMPNPCTRNIESWRAGLPSVMICDPTVALDTSKVQSLRSVVLSLVRCVESYVATAFNPPADGMALDGLSRCVKTLPKTEKQQSINIKREVMAAGLNAAFSQEKGVGPASLLSALLVDIAKDLDQAELAQLILTHAVELQQIDSDKADTLLNVFGQRDDNLTNAVTKVFEAAPAPRSLSDLGLNMDHLDKVAGAATGHAGLNFKSARALLDAVY